MDKKLTTKQKGKKVYLKTKNIFTILFSLVLISSCKTIKPYEATASANAENNTKSIQINNPIIKDKFTADPAALVYKDRVYVYTGHDEAENDFHFYKMKEWLVYSSSDMVNWEEHPVPLKVSDFAWAKADGCTIQVIERNGKFDWNNTTHKAAPYVNRDPRFYANILYDGAKWRERPDDVKATNPLGIIETGKYQQANGTFVPGLDTQQRPIEDCNGSYTGSYIKKLLMNLLTFNM